MLKGHHIFETIQPCTPASKGVLTWSPAGNHGKQEADRGSAETLLPQLLPYSSDGDVLQLRCGDRYTAHSSEAVTKTLKAALAQAPHHLDINNLQSGDRGIALPTNAVMQHLHGGDNSTHVEYINETCYGLNQS